MLVLPCRDFLPTGATAVPEEERDPDCIEAGWTRAVQLMVIRNGSTSTIVLCLMSPSLVS
jgi:hypothetical protein